MCKVDYKWNIVIHIELFPDCKSYRNFLTSKGIEGEVILDHGLLAIDPLGAMDERDIVVVQCEMEETIMPEPNVVPCMFNLFILVWVHSMVCCII